MTTDLAERTESIEATDPGDWQPGDPVPEGWTIDRDTGQLRPYSRPGRPRKQKTADEIQAAPPAEPKPDEPPGPGRPSGWFAPPVPGTVPDMPKGGVIAKGVNKLYRKAGKIVRAADHDIGQAVIECARKDKLADGKTDDPDDVTVGEAWEALAKENPRVRAWLLRIIAGGTYWDLVIAHAPIGAAMIARTSLMDRILSGRGFFARLVGSWTERDEDSTDADLTQADIGDMADLADGQLQRMARKMARSQGMSDADVAEAMERLRSGKLTPPYEGHDLPDSEADGTPGQRNQPHRQNRQQRRTAAARARRANGAKERVSSGT